MVFAEEEALFEGVDVEEEKRRGQRLLVLRHLDVRESSASQQLYYFEFEFAQVEVIVGI